MTSFVLGLSPPHSDINVDEDQKDWLTLLHLIASHQPAHLQHDYTTILLQVGDVTPVRSFPTMWEAATMIMIGQCKQGDVWLEGHGDVQCPEVCRNDKYQTGDGYLTPANNQFIALCKNCQEEHLVCQRGAHCCDLCLDATRASCFTPAC